MRSCGHRTSTIHLNSSVNGGWVIGEIYQAVAVVNLNVEQAQHLEAGMPEVFRYQLRR